LSHLRSAFLLPLVVAIAACSGGGGGGSDDTDGTGTPGVEEPGSPGAEEPGTAPSLTLAITSQPELLAQKNERWTYQVETEFTDNLTFTLVQAPEGMTVDEDGLIVWVPDGTITSADVVLAVGYVNGTDVRGNYQSFTLSVPQPLEIISEPPETTAKENLRWTYQVETEFTDNLTFTLLQAPTGMTIDEDGLIEWVPDGSITSADVTLAISYVNGAEIRNGTQSFSINVRPVNNKPEFITLVDDLPISAVAGSIFSYQFDVSDPDDANNGTDLTFAVELPYVSSTPEEYGVAISPTGLLTWQVPASPNLLLRWTGLRIRVTVTDGQEDWKTSLVAVPSLAWNLKVVESNEAPVINTEVLPAATEDLLYSVTLDVTDIAGTEEDGTPIDDDLSFSLTDAPEGMTISSEGVITWTPGESGSSESYSETVTVVVQDGLELGVEPVSRTYELTVNPVNDAPVINSTPRGTALLGDVYRAQLDFSDSDDAAEDLTFSVVSGPEGMTISAAGLIEWTPVAEGTVTAEVMVADGGEDGAMPASVSWSIVVDDNNEPPMIIQGSDISLTTDEDTAVELRLTATDADEDDLTWTVSVAPENGTAGVSGIGLAGYVPNVNFNGTDSFEITVTDGIASASVAVTVTVTAVNDAPVITSSPVTIATEDEAYSYTLTATDAENDVLEWSLSTAPEGMMIDPATGVISWIPAGDTASESVVVMVADDSASTTQSFTVVVTQVNDAPVFITDAVTDATEDTQYVYSAVAEDDDGDTLTYSLVEGPEGMQMNAQSGRLTWTPAEGETSADVIIAVTDDSVTVEQSFTVTVAAVNDAPVITEGAAIALAATEDTEALITLNATDIENDELTWSVGREAANGTATASGTGTSIQVSYLPAPDFAGQDSFSVVVSDNDLTAEITVNVTVAAVNDVPVITSVARTEATEDVAYEYDVNAMDADGDTLTYALASVVEGMTIDAQTGVISWTPTEGVTSASVEVTVSDTQLSDSQSFTVNVTAVNDAPVITSVAVLSATEGEEYRYQATATDVDSESLSWSLSQKPAGMTVDAETGLITWTPANGVTTAAVTLVVSDNDKTASQAFTITVEGVNDAPVITEGETASLTTAEDTTAELTLNATDADGNDLTWSIAGQPGKGSASVENGVVTYTPDTDYNGGDLFVVQVSDAELSDSILVTVNVTAVNDAPVITSAAKTAAVEGEEYSYQVTTNDVDGDAVTLTLTTAPEGMSMTAQGLITWTPGNGVTSAQVVVTAADAAFEVTQSFGVTVTATNDAPVITSTPVTSAMEDETYRYDVNATDAEGNTLTYLLTSGPEGMQINSATGEITWTPGEGVSGATVVVTVSDSLDQTTQSFDITVTAVNDAPVITEGESIALSASEDTAAELQLNATDVDSSELTWAIASNPANGSATVVAGLVTYTPDTDYTGEDSFTVSVSDGEFTDVITVNVTVGGANDAPVITSEALLEATEDELYEYTVTATDADGDDLSFSLTQAPEGMTISSEGQITWTPVEGVTGASVTVQVSDSTAAVTQSFTITVAAVNDAPEITSQAVTTASEDAEYRYSVTAVDVDGDELTFSLETAPEGMVISDAGVITWTPENGATSADVTVVVSDRVLSVSQSFSITVNAENDAPVIDQGESTALTLDEDNRAGTVLTATDIDGDELTWSISVDAGHGTATVNDGEVSYTPAANFYGSDVFTVTVSDETLSDSILVEVTINSVNDAPVFSNVASTSAVEGSQYRYAAAVTDADDANNGTDLIFTLVTAPEGMEVSATGVVTWTPANGVTSADVSLQVEDGREDDAIPAVQSWTITVGGVNDAPVITSVAPTEATEDELYQYAVQVTDPDDENNGTDLTFTLVSAPEGMTVSSMGLIEWTPANGVESANVIVRVADGGESGVEPVNQSWTITVTPVNDAPVISDQPFAIETSEDVAGSVTLVAEDIDSETLTWTITGEPANGSASFEGALLTYTPDTDYSGTDNITVQVSDGELSDSVTVSVQVNETNDAPVITSAAVTSATEDEAYGYTVTATDADGDALSFALQVAPEGMTINGETGAITWTPANGVASANVTVNVTDQVDTVSQSFTITVEAVNDAPVITSEAVTTATEDVQYRYEVVATDVDSEDLTYTLTDAPEGMAIDSQGVITWTPENGVESGAVTLVVSDGFLSATQQFTVVVTATNDAPEITQGEAITLNADEDGETSTTLTATDADGDDLTWSVSIEPSNGIATVEGGAVSYTPAANFNGEDSFEVRVADESAADTITVTVVVAAANDAPVITSVAVTAATEDELYRYQVTASDVDNDALTFTLTSAPEGMTMSAAGLIEWTPANGVSSGAVTVSVSDDVDTVTQSFEVTVRATNDAPVFVSSPVTTAREDETYTYDVNATDADGNELSYSLLSAPEGMTIDPASGVITWTPLEGVTDASVVVQVTDGIAPVTQGYSIDVEAVNDAPVITGLPLSITTDEDNAGSLSLTATDAEGADLSWSIGSNATHGNAVVSGSSVTYMPAADYNGEDSFTVSVSDGSLTDTVTVSVNVAAANDAPVITSEALLEATEDEAYSYSVAANDVDGDDITFTLSAKPEGMTISDEGVIAWTPAEGVTSAAVTVVASDTALSASQSFTITVIAVNDAPVITSEPVTAAAEDTQYEYSVVATDAENDALTYELTEAPEGMAINTTGLITWTPENGVSSASVTVVVSDNALSVTQSYTITVSAENDAPVIAGAATRAITTDEDVAAALTLSASDVDSEELTWSISSPAAHGNATVSAGEVSYTPAADYNGNDTFTVSVSDGSLSDSVVVNVTVNAVADAPVITEGEMTARTTEEDVVLTFALNATDADAGDTLTWGIQAPAEMGLVAVSGMGTSQTVSYTPASNFNGNDTFVVRVSDGSDLTDTIRVNISVSAVNDLPVITTTAVTEATEGEAYSYEPAATDADNDTLSWNVSRAPASMTVNPDTGALSWTPANGDTSAVVDLVVSDASGSTTQTFTISVVAVNDAPVITQGATVAVTMSEDGSPQAFALVLNATDVDNSAAELQWSVSSDASNGSASVSGTGTSKTVSYTPTTGYVGTDSFEVTVSDGTAEDKITVNVTIESVNAAPVIDQGESTTVTLDEDDSATLNLTATDADGDTLTWSVVTGVTNGGLNVNPDTGVAIYVPAENFHGTDSFTVRVSDGDLTDEIAVSVTVTSINDVPVITQGSSINVEVAEDGEVEVNLSATDADGDDLTWALLSGAQNGVIIWEGSQFNYSPAIDFNGDDSFSVQVSDGTATGSATINVTVTAVNDAPFVTSEAVTTATEYQAYRYDVVASDAENDTISFSLTTAPAGMQIDGTTGAISWMPEASGDFDVVVAVSDSVDADSHSFTISVAAEPAVAGRAVKGVLANADVEAAVYAGLVDGEHTWSVIGTTVTDANGYFGFDLAPQSAPVRVRVTTNIESTMVCDTPSGCLLAPFANFGDSGAPAEGLTLDTIVSGADFAGAIAVTPMTNMAANWLESFPQALDDNNVLLAHRRMAKLIGFADESWVHHRMVDITNSFERAYGLNSDEEVVRHALFAAALQETAITEAVSVDTVSRNIGLIFGVLGGQMPLKSGVVDVSSLNLEDGTTEVSYTGFDTIVANAKTVAAHVNSGELDSMIAGFDSLVTSWTPDADPAVCLSGDPELDRTECRNVTTIAEATGYNATDFARAMAPINVAAGYYADATAAENAMGDRTNRDLGWLYADATAQENTANMLSGFSELLGYGLKTAVCVPQKNNIPFACEIEKSEGYESLSATLSSCRGVSFGGDDSCTLSVSGTVSGQTFSVTSRIKDIRYLLGGDRGSNDFTAGPLPMCFNGTIANSTATLRMTNLCLVLDVSSSPEDVIDDFENLDAGGYIDLQVEGSPANLAMTALIAQIRLKISLTGAMSFTSTNNSIGVYSLSNMDNSFFFDRVAVNNTSPDATDPVFIFETNTLSRTNSWGETSSSIAGAPMFRLELNNVTKLTTLGRTDNVGVPPIVTETDATVDGLDPVVSIAKQYALSFIDANQEAPTPDWDAVLAEVQAELGYIGTVTRTIEESSGDKTYVFTLEENGDSIQVSGENSTENAMTLYLSGATGYIYGGDTLVGTAHLGNSQDGLQLSLVDGSVQTYPNANPDPMAGLQDFLDFLQVLIPPAEETAAP
jgi:VCBS repeat-containing protein